MGNALEIYSAYDQKKISELGLMSKSHIEEILTSSKELFEDKSKKLSIEKRVSVLQKTASIIREKREVLALEASAEGGKPLVDSLVEIDRAAEGIDVAIEELSHIHGTEVPMGLSKASENRMAYTKKIPRGVVLAISAFNHPFNLIVHQVIPAVAVGCPVIVKPAMTTPLSCKNLIEILYEAGLPKEWCTMVLCENDSAEILVTSPKISFLTFIGSSKVGWYLRSKLAPGVTCALEHGGAAPAIVDETANLKTALPKLVRGGFYHAGQVCVSVQRLIVHKSLMSDFSKAFVSEVQKLQVGDPQKLETDVGPLILPREVDRVESWVNEAVAEGAHILCGGERISDTCYAPTVLLNVATKSKVSNFEIFGPVVCLYEYEDLDEAIMFANSLNYAFQASIFTKNLDAAYKAIEDLDGLAIMINDHTAFRVDWMPFGGYKESGMGVGGIGHTMNDLMIEKMFVLNK